MSEKYDKLTTKLHAWVAAYNDEKPRTLNAKEICADCGAAAEAIETLRQENELLEARLAHLLQSETIKDYDERNRETQDYMLDITELDSRVMPRMYYVCDRRACDCCNPECSHTCDPRHAKHFEGSGLGGLFEMEAHG